MRIAHLTTVDLSLRYLILPQLEAAVAEGESFGISAPGAYVPELEERGIVHIPLSASTRGMNVVSDIRAMCQFWKAVRRIEPDVVHTHNPKPGVYGRILARLAGVPIVVNTVHGLYATPDSSGLKRAVVYTLEAFASRFSDAELIQNPEDLELLARRGIVSQSKLRLLGNGVDLERFNPDRSRELRATERARLGLGEGEVAVGMVGRLVAEKGVPELIEAFEDVNGPVKLLIAGPVDLDKDDALTSDLLESARDAGVEFVGMRTDIEAFYAALDIFVLPSHREGFPRAAMEAAACGLPLILTNIRGCRQVVDDGVNGRLVPVRDPDRLALAIDELALAPDLRARMGQASTEKARSDFDERRVVEIVMDTYRSLATEKGLAWKFRGSDTSTVSIRPATTSDSLAIANLHAGMIDSGFLSSLGPSFLDLLYRALISGRYGDVLVAETDNGVVGFVAGTSDTGSFYREFITEHLLQAVVRLAPALTRPRTWRRIWETLRYGSSRDEPVKAELLSMAVAESARRRGVGRRLVSSLIEKNKERKVRAMKVVVGASNESAIRLYQSCGFGEERVFEVHTGESSRELTWRS